MKKELSKNLMAISIRNGVEVYIEKDRLENLKAELEKRRFIEVDERIINVADIVGIFPAQDIEDKVRRQQGQWKDKEGNWHNKGDKVCPTCGNVIPYGKTCGYCG